MGRAGNPAACATVPVSVAGPCDCSSTRHHCGCSRDFRRLWIGAGRVVPRQHDHHGRAPVSGVPRRRGSSLAVGLLGLAQLGPLLACSLFGGAIADRIDKRRLLLGGQRARRSLCSAALAANAALDHPQVWLLYRARRARAAGIAAVTYPVTRSLLPLLDRGGPPTGRVRAAGDLRLVRHDGRARDRRSPSSPRSGSRPRTRRCLSRVAFPPLALARLHRLARAVATPCAPPIAAMPLVLQGLRLPTRGQSVIMSVFGIDLLAMVFGMPLGAPPRARGRVGRRPAKLYGLLLALDRSRRGPSRPRRADGRARVRREGCAVLLAVTVWGAAIGVAGLTQATGARAGDVRGRRRRRHDLRRLPLDDRSEREQTPSRCAGGSAGSRSRCTPVAR